jgi:hypothetical protein
MERIFRVTSQEEHVTTIMVPVTEKMVNVTVKMGLLQIVYILLHFPVWMLQRARVCYKMASGCDLFILPCYSHQLTCYNYYEHVTACFQRSTG